MEKVFENKWFLLIVIAITWGSSFILLKKSLLIFTPYEVSALRVAVSCLILAYISFPALRRMKKNTSTVFATTVTFSCRSLAITGWRKVQCVVCNRRIAYLVGNLFDTGEEERYSNNPKVILV